MFLFVYFERLLQCRPVTDLFIAVEMCVTVLWKYFVQQLCVRCVNFSDTGASALVALKAT